MGKIVSARAYVPRALFRSLGGLGLLAWIVQDAALAQSAADRLEGPIPAEVEAFRQAAQRAHARLEELHADTRDYVSMMQQQKRHELETGFDELLGGLEDTDRDRRKLAIERLEAFLDHYPDSHHSSSVRFRLAELYYQGANERYLNDANAYFQAAESDDLEVLEALGEPPKLDLARSIAEYQKIIDANLLRPPDQRWERLDGVFVMLGFCHFVETSAQWDEDRAKAVFRQLIQEVPNSDFVDRSYLFLGNTAFNASQYDEAIAEYEAIMAKGPQAAYYSEAQYQLAWARFKLNQFDQALTLFSEILDRSEDQKSRTGQESSFAPDARRFMAFSFAELGVVQNRDAARVAQEYFDTRGHKQYEHEVFVQLGDVMKRYDRVPEAVQVYKYLQVGPGGEWRFSRDNPRYQNEVTGLYSKVQELELAGEERLQLTTLYGEQSEWWRQNRNDPDALAAARGFIEDELLYVAEEYYVRADQSGRPEDYTLAAAKFREYLETFPIADDFYKRQWYLANALKNSGDWPAASAEFEKMFRSRKYHVYGDAALYEVMNARYQVMQNQSGPSHLSCEGCNYFDVGVWKGADEAASPSAWTVERTYASKGDNPVEIPVYALPDDRIEFIEAADVLRETQWTEVDPRKLPEGFPDYRGAFEKQRHLFLYLTGQVLYYANQYEPARQRFEKVVREFPRTDEASYAAGLIVDSYLAEGDLEQVRKQTRRFSTTILGPSDVPTNKFQSLLEGSTFKLAGQKASEGDNLGAAEAYLAFIDEFPKSENVPPALNNAAFYFSEAGKKEKAAELYEEFVNRFPQHEESKKLYYVIASQYEATFDLERAVDFYERLVSRFPEDPNTPDALWEASLLKVGLGRYAEAAKGYEEYAKRYPDKEDREETFWRAGEQWEKVGDEQALSFYRRYLDTFGLQNPDHAIEAEYRIAKVYDRRNDKRGYDRQLDKIVDTFDKIRAKGGAIGATGIEYAASAEFRSLQSAYDDLVKDQLTGNDDKDSKILNEEKPIQLKEFEGKTRAFVSKYAGNFEWNSGALYLQGMAALYYASLGLSIQCPKGLSDEDCWAFEEVLEERVFPQFYEVEKVGIQKLTELMDVAKQRKKHSPFIDMALAELNKRDPLGYPAVKAELRGETRPAAPFRYVPLMSSGEIWVPPPPPVLPTPLTMPEEAQGEIEAEVKVEEALQTGPEQAPAQEEP